MKVALLGATAKTDRYAYRALEKLIEKKHEVYPVHPKLELLMDKKVYSSVTELNTPIDTLTLYIGKTRSDTMVKEIIALKPRRIIFNPGAENELLRDKAELAGIETLNACTLVMLTTGQF